MAKVKAAHQVVKLICDIPNDDPAPGDRVETPAEFDGLASNPGAGTLLLAADSMEALESITAKLNRLNTGSKSAVLWAGAPTYNEALGKFETLGFIQPLTPEEMVKKPRRRFGFVK